MDLYTQQMRTMFSKTCIYAMKTMIYLAIKSKEGVAYVSVVDVSEAIDSPKHFTAKILQQLSKANLLNSQRGPNGGFFLPPESGVSLADIVRAIDGNQLLDGCILGFKECSELRRCPAHHKLQSVRDYLKGTLTSTNIEELSEVVLKENGFLKM